MAEEAKEEQPKKKQKLQCPANFRKDNNEFCDLFMSVDGTHFDLHRIIMAHSMKQYVQVHTRTAKQMDGAGSEPSNRILLKNFVGGASVFEDVVQYCYGEDSFAVTDSNFAGLYYGEQYFQMSREEEGSLYCLIQAHLFGNKIDPQRLGHLCLEALEVEHKHGYPKELSSHILGLISSQMKSKADQSSSQPLWDFVSCLLKDAPLNLPFAKGIDVALSNGVDASTKSKIITQLVLCAHHEKRYYDKNEAAERENKLEEALAHLLKTGLQFADLSFQDVTGLLAISKQCFQLFEYHQLGFVRSFLDSKVVHNIKIPVDFVKVLYSSWGQSFAQMCENDEERRVFIDIMDTIARGAAEPEDWKNMLKVGDLVDAYDCEGEWLEGKVVELMPGSAKIHFRGWLAKYDEIISLDSDKLSPLHSMSPPWREKLKPGDLVEVANDLTQITMEDGTPWPWIRAEVLEVRHCQGMPNDGSIFQSRVLVQWIDSRDWGRCGKKWVDLNGEEICPSNTHIRD